MAIPDYVSVMLPLLNLLADQQQHIFRDAIESLAMHFHLTDDERQELLPSGKQPKFDNRVGWARTYLKKAGLVEDIRRGTFRITRRGLELLATNPSVINSKFLQQFPEFREFQTIQRPDNKIQVDKVEELHMTPQEILESSYQTIRRSLSQELLEQVKKSSPTYFEKIVVDLLVAMGYGGSRKDAGTAIGRPGDGGIDGTINEDRLGLDIVYIQAKRWDNTVGRPIVQAFAGSLDGNRATKGILVTTSQFSQDAKDYVRLIPKKIVLIDGEQLAQYMIDYGVGVSVHESYVVKKMDLDYFGEE